MFARLRLNPSRFTTSSAQRSNEGQHDGDADEDAEGDDYLFESFLIHETARLVFEKSEHNSNLKKHTLFRKRSVQLFTVKDEPESRRVGESKKIIPDSPALQFSGS